MNTAKLFTIIVAFPLLIGCGSYSDPTQSSFSASVDKGAGLSPYSTRLLDTENHTLWGYYALEFDLESLDVEAIPDRAAQVHWNVTGLLRPPKCYDCLVLEVTSHDPVSQTIVVDVALRNPTTALTGYDVRGIVLPKVPGVRVLNADSYTNLWNSDACYARNPFLAFAKDVGLRAFDPQVWHSRTYEINYDSRQALANIGYAIDVSWPDNCLEPYEITLPETPPTFINEQMTTIEVEVLDWQDDIEWVVIYPYPLYLDDSLDVLPFYNTSGNTWSVSFWNDNRVEAGSYLLWIQAKSFGTDIRTWHILQVNVEYTIPPPPYYIDCKAYVACDADGSLPYIEDPFGDKHEFNYIYAETLRALANQFWRNYGFYLGSSFVFYDVMNEDLAYDQRFYVLDDLNEMIEMHERYGKSKEPDYLSMYFVQELPSGYDASVCVWPEWVDTVAEHRSENAFIVFTPDAWFSHESMARECGHAFGALQDITLIDPAHGYFCEDLNGDSPPWLSYLYCDDDAYYEGNLMYVWMPIQTDEYTLTVGQAEWVLSFNQNHPTNWIY